jgi:hypothetical protein
MPPGLGGMRSQRRSSERAGVIEGGEGVPGDHGSLIPSAIDAGQGRDIERPRRWRDRHMAAGVAEACMVLELKPHPTCPPRGIERVQADVRREDNRLELYWRIVGDMDRVLLPKPVEPKRADDLWKHTCFEVFLRSQGSPAYLEINLSPSGAWAAYRFEGRREGMANVMEPLRLTQQTRGRDWGYRVWASLDLSKLWLAEAPLWQAAMTAVIEERDERKSYWAIDHFGKAADFHDPAGFLLTLPRSNKT